MSGPTLPGGLTPVDPVLVTNELLRAIQKAASFASGAQDAREISECGTAALAFAQAVITLDPTRLAGGDTPAARAAAAPTAPTRPSQPPTKDGNHNGIIGG